MDKQTLKSTIIELKNDNRTFQEVSDILKNDYNIIMSRQAVHGMYSRAISSKQMDRNIDLLIATSDISNYSALGYGSKQIKEMLYNQGKDISIDTINRTLDNCDNHINNIKIDMINKTTEAIKKNMDIDYIIGILSYKGVKPTKIVVDELIELASTEILKSRTIDLMVKLINITDNKELAKKVANKHNFNVTGKEISEALNK